MMTTKRFKQLLELFGRASETYAMDGRWTKEQDDAAKEELSKAENSIVKYATGLVNRINKLERKDA